MTNCANRSLGLANVLCSAICSLDLHNSFLGWIAIHEFDLHNLFLWIYWFRRFTQFVLSDFTV